MEEAGREKIEHFTPEELGREAFEEWHTEREISRSDSEKERSKVPSSSVYLKIQDREEVKKKEETKKAKIKGKIKYLLFLAEDKGLSHAIKKVRKENDPFLLDVFHDILAKNETYLKFLKK